MKKVNLKQALKALGYEIVQHHNNYNARSGFMKKEGQLYYFSYEDLRWSPTLMVRTADASVLNKKGEFADFRGGQNTYPQLERLGLYIEEKRKSWDGA